MHAPGLLRRATLKKLATGGLALMAAPLLGAACGGKDDKATATAGSATDEGTADAIDASKWASGGTAAMLAASSYPDPFSGAAPSACSVTCQATAGPCYLASGAPPSRIDVSEGQDGLPMRIALRLVDASCAPLAQAKVEMWHTSAAGLYSGQTPNTQFCSNGNQAAVAAQWFRGVAVSDAAGKLHMDSCFPGWYTSRTIHVHFTITTAAGDSVTTQLFFADAVSDAIVANQPLYKDRGARDTTNQNDSVVSAAAAPNYCFDVAQMADGAMLASKTLVLRKSPSDALCTIPAGSAKSGTGATANAPGGPAPGSKIVR